MDYSGNTESYRIHDWIYDIVCEICYDHEYIYLSYIRCFNSLIDQIFSSGNTIDEGKCTFSGIKSNYKAEIDWKLHHRVNFVGFNVVIIKCVIEDIISGLIVKEMSKNFEISSGEVID
jgi:hypothetical protein